MTILVRGSDLTLTSIPSVQAFLLSCPGSSC